MSINAEKIEELRKLLGRILKENAAVTKYGQAHGALLRNASRARVASSFARYESSAQELHRLLHEAHCLAVEIGIADMRDKSHYAAQRLAGGALGGCLAFHGRAPEVSA